MITCILCSDVVQMFALKIRGYTRSTLNLKMKCRVDTNNKHFFVSNLIVGDVSH
jgi:hypothetical protein